MTDKNLCITRGGNGNGNDNGNDNGNGTQIMIKFQNKTVVFDENKGSREITNPLVNEMIQSHYKKNFLYCLNCNKKGHNSKNCRFPTNSYGCIVYKILSDNVIRYLMIQRKYTPVYVELLRARYYDGKVLNHKYLCQLVSELPLTERNYIIKHDFGYLWTNLWRWAGTEEQLQCIVEEYKDCQSKFDLLKSGFEESKCGFLSFESLFDNYPTHLIEPEWEFPKGKRIDGESDQQCAIRECGEETSLEADDYKLLLYVKPFQEKFLGINQVKYCNSYYLAELININKSIYYDPFHVEQNKEIRKIGWFTAHEVNKLLRSDYKHRTKMFEDVDRLIKNKLR